METGIRYSDTVLDAVLARAFCDLPSATAVVDLDDGAILIANTAMYSLWGFPQSEDCGNDPDATSGFRGFGERLKSLAGDAESWRGEMSMQRADGTLFEIGVAARRLHETAACLPRMIASRLRGDAAEPRLVVVTLTDITERKRAKLRAERQTHMYEALSKTVEAVIRSSTQEEMLESVCRIAVAEGGLSMAWAGFIEENGLELRPSVQHGMNPSLLSRLVLSLDADHPHGRSPAATAARTGRHCVINDFQNHPDVLPWRGDAVRDGIQGGAAFPLSKEGRVVGVIAFYAREKDLFSAAMVDLLDRMAMNISFALDKLATDRNYKEINETLELRVQQRTAELKVALQELESFSYSVSHDLRAPLRSIDGFSRLVMDEYSDQIDATGQSYLARVRTNAQRMGLLIDAILDLSRVTRASMKRVDVDMAQIAGDVIEHLRREHPDRLVDVYIPDQLHVDADAPLLHVALENLLSNAWKYSSKREHAEIELGMLDQEGMAVYYVRDNGAGFDMAQASRLFGAFERLHHAQDYQGTGIDLATVRRIIHRHGGQVWAESQPDRGATFYFTLRGEYDLPPDF